jgi:hypothetical protein
MNARIAWIIRNRIVLIGVAVIAIAVLLPLMANRVLGDYPEKPAASTVHQAQAAPVSGETAQANPAKQVVHVGIYLLSIGNLNTTTGTYDADFFLNFRCETQGCDPSKFDVMNAAEVVTPEDQTSVDSAKEGKYFYRWRGSLQTNLDLRDFPFDRHTLTIELEDKNLNNQDLQYVIDDTMSGIDPQVIVAGWRLDSKIVGKVIPHEYAVFDGAWDRSIFSLNIDHPLFASFMKSLFAAIVIVLVGMLSFAMHHDSTSERLGLTSSTLVGAILYHLTLTSSIPPVGYLTFADSFMMMNYVFVFLALGITVTLMLLMDGKHEDRAIQLHKSTRLLVPFAWLVASIVLTLFQFIKI